MSLESRAVRVLCAFYAKHDSSKTQADIEAIVAKRAKKTGVLTEQAFADVCSKLAAKYGECPMAFCSDSDDDYRGLRIINADAAIVNGLPNWPLVLAARKSPLKLISGISLFRGVYIAPGY